MVPYDAQDGAEETAAEEAAPEGALEGSLEDVGPGGDEPAAERVVDGAADGPDDGAADERVVDGAADGPDDGAADDADAPECPVQIAGAIDFVIPSTNPSCNQII